MAHGRRSSPPGKLLAKRGQRYDREHQERTRQKIADSGVLDRLTRCMLGEIELSQGQIAIGLKFIDKLVPNLQSVEQEVTQTTPFAVLPSQAPSAEAWQKAFAPKAAPTIPSPKPPSGAVKPVSPDTKH